ncbi:TrbG/VirB9 family P-type conjugative transfer protein [Campylobacter helveticus]|uniref:TrbG/VirB9 family P-type conjugative transfer protein n=1 Tax=Campylobacter helveticus TaxID=28898 RepID=UPI0022EB03D5|nr:TrbG/VirB9 family P-type conjugative transfer protein [Campylobacter helveticus]
MKKTLISSIIAFLALNPLQAQSNEEINQKVQELYEAQQTSQSASQGESLFSGKPNQNNPATSYIKDNFGDSQVELANATNHPQLYNENASLQSYEGQMEEGQLELMKNAIRNQNLNALQGTFFNKKYQGTENTKNLYFENDKTQKIRTRFAMATTLIFETDIKSYILGDSTGFKIEEIPDLPNAIAVKPLLIGIDTSLTIFTKDNKLHTFYLFSTDYKSNKNPDLVVYVKDEESKKYNEKKQKELEKDYLIIKEGIAEMRVKKSDIYRGYKQKAKKANAHLLAEEIFDDKQFTYFKYDKKKMPQIPSVFVVIDKQDSPIETRVIGNYIIAETTAKQFSIVLGDSYVCVERIEPKNEKPKKVQNATIKNYTPLDNKPNNNLKPKTKEL